MDVCTKGGESPDLLRLANQMRASAADTVDRAYMDMFLRAAAILEERASQTASDTLPIVATGIRGHG